MEAQQIEAHIRDGWQLTQGWHSGAFFLEKDREKIHVYYSDVAPLFENNIVTTVELVGEPPGGYWTYRLVEQPKKAREPMCEEQTK